MASRGIGQYREVINEVCNIKKIEDYKELEGTEKDSCLGIAMILSVMHGVKAKIQDLSLHLGISYGDLAEPFYRLRDNGVFNAETDVRNDRVLKGAQLDMLTNQWMPAEHATQVSWAHLAGIAAGVCGLRNDDDISRYG